MGIALNHEKYVENVYKKRNKHDIEFLSEYTGMKNNITVKCLVCGYIWSPRADALYYYKCPKCADKSKRTSNDDFLEKIPNILEKFELLSEYKTVKEKIKVRCKKCGKIRYMDPHNIERSKVCPSCAGLEKKNHEDFCNELFQINSDIKVISEYKGVDKYVKCKCDICGNIWDARAGHLLSGIGCPQCNESKGEREIRHYLAKNGISFEAQKKFSDCIGVGGKHLRFDFYLPDYNTLIEFQGVQHEKPIEIWGGDERFCIQKNNDNIKKRYCLEHKINFLEIKYSELNAVPDILDRYIHNIHQN